MINSRHIILFLVFILLARTGLRAEETVSRAQVYLNNGDKISGEIVSEDGDSIKIKNELVGAVSIKKSGVREVLYRGEEEKARGPDSTGEEKKEKPGPWSGDFSLGYDKTGGNTRESNLAARLLLNRKTEKDEFTVKGEMFYSSSNDKMDAQKWYNMFRYAYSFHERKWYNFYKIENDHDRFANISYRFVPSLGVGYWFSDTPGLKLVLEAGIGLEHTEFRRDARDQNKAVLLPRAMFEKAVFGRSRISQEVLLYPYLDGMGEYRLHSETAFINPINKKLSLRLSFVDDYDSDPTGDAKKNDYRFISALSYSF